MERFLDTAASLGLVKRWHGRSRRHHKAAAVYAPNALTAALTEHGDGVANMAKMMSALHYEAHGKLAEVSMEGYGLMLVKITIQYGEHANSAIIGCC